MSTTEVDPFTAAIHGAASSDGVDPFTKAIHGAHGPDPFTKAIASNGSADTHHFLHDALALAQRGGSTIARGVAHGAEVFEDALAPVTTPLVNISQTFQRAGAGALNTAVQPDHPWQKMAKQVALPDQTATDPVTQDSLGRLANMIPAVLRTGGMLSRHPNEPIDYRQALKNEPVTDVKSGLRNAGRQILAESVTDPSLLGLVDDPVVLGIKGLKAGSAFFKAQHATQRAAEAKKATDAAAVTHGQLIDAVAKQRAEPTTENEAAAAALRAKRDALKAKAQQLKAPPQPNVLQQARDKLFDHEILSPAVDHQLARDMTPEAKNNVQGSEIRNKSLQQLRLRALDTHLEKLKPELDQEQARLNALAPGQPRVFSPSPEVQHMLRRGAYLQGTHEVRATLEANGYIPTAREQASPVLSILHSWSPKDEQYLNATPNLHAAVTKKITDDMLEINKASTQTDRLNALGITRPTGTTAALQIALERAEADGDVRRIHTLNARIANFRENHIKADAHIQSMLTDHGLGKSVETVRPVGWHQSPEEQAKIFETAQKMGASPEETQRMLTLADHEQGQLTLPVTLSARLMSGPAAKYGDTWWSGLSDRTRSVIFAFAGGHMKNIAELQAEGPGGMEALKNAYSLYGQKMATDRALELKKPVNALYSKARGGDRPAEEPNAVRYQQTPGPHPEISPLRGGTFVSRRPEVPNLEDAKAEAHDQIYGEGSIHHGKAPTAATERDKAELTQQIHAWNVRNHRDWDTLTPYKKEPPLVQRNDTFDEPNNDDGVELYSPEEKTQHEAYVASLPPQAHQTFDVAEHGRPTYDEQAMLDGSHEDALKDVLAYQPTMDDILTSQYHALDNRTDPAFEGGHHRVPLMYEPKNALKKETTAGALRHVGINRNEIDEDLERLSRARQLHLRNPDNEKYEQIYHAFAANIVKKLKDHGASNDIAEQIVESDQGRYVMADRILGHRARALGHDAVEKDSGEAFVLDPKVLRPPNPALVHQIIKTSGAQNAADWDARLRRILDRGSTVEYRDQENPFSGKRMFQMGDKIKGIPGTERVMNATGKFYQSQNAMLWNSELAQRFALDEFLLKNDPTYKRLEAIGKQAELRGDAHAAQSAKFQQGAVINKVLFNYFHQSPLAQTLRAIGAPFPHWRIGNAAHQLRQMHDDPARLTRIMKVENILTRAVNPPTPGGEMFDANLPSDEATKFVTEPLKYGVGTMGTAGELLHGQDTDALSDVTGGAANILKEAARNYIFGASQVEDLYDLGKYKERTSGAVTAGLGTLGAYTESYPSRFKLQVRQYMAQHGVDEYTARMKLEQGGMRRRGL